MPFILRRVNSLQKSADSAFVATVSDSGRKCTYEAIFVRRLLPYVCENQTVRDPLGKSTKQHWGGRRCSLAKRSVGSESSPNADMAVASGAGSDYASEQRRTCVGADFPKGSVDQCLRPRDRETFRPTYFLRVLGNVCS